MEINPAAVLAAIPWPTEGLAALVEQLPVGIAIAEAPSGRLLLGNPAMERIWGHPVLPAADVDAYVQYRGAHLDGRPLAPREWPLARAVQRGEAVQNERIRFQRADGSWGTMLVSAAPLRDRDGRIVAGVVAFEDITEERLARDRAERLQSAAAALSRAISPAEVVDAVVEEVSSALGASGVVLLSLADGGEQLELMAACGYPEALLEPWRSVPIAAPLPIATAVRSRRSCTYDTRADVEAEFPGLAPIMERTGSQALGAFPLLSGERSLGVLGVSFTAPHEFDESECAFVQGIVDQCAVALERAWLFAAEQRARQAAEAAERRLAVLADAAHAFAGYRFELEGVLDAVTRRVADLIGDGCAVLLRSEDGERLEPAAVFQRDPEALALVREMLEATPILATQEPHASVLATGQPVLLAGLSVDQIRSLLQPEHRVYLERFGVYSSIEVPLRATTGRIGIVAAWRTTPDQPYRDEDVVFLQELADRAALAIENTQLFVAERSAREEAERLAVEAQGAVRARDEFLSIAAHELKTPMTSLVGYAQLVLRQLARQGSVDPERVRLALKQIEAQSRRLGSLIDQLLDVARLETGKLQLHRQLIDLGELAAEIASLLAVGYPQRAVVVQAPTQAAARVDPLRLGQVLTNLFENGLKFSPPGSAVRADLEREAGWVVIRVRDHGPGIPTEERGLVFDRFYQAEDAERQGGMGLGLYVSKQLVELHGGTIAIESPEDGGTCVVVRLPVPEREA